MQRFFVSKILAVKFIVLFLIKRMKNPSLELLSIKILVTSVSTVKRSLGSNLEINSV